MKIVYWSVSILLWATVAQANDRYYVEQIELEKAWQLSKGSADVKMAIIGTGVNYQLDSLASTIEKNVQEMGDGKESDGIDNDNNGYVDDVWGANTNVMSGDPQDLYGVSTHVTSVIADASFGIAPGIKIIPIAVSAADGTSTYDAILRAFEYAKSRGANLIELGVGGGLPANAWESCRAIEDAQVPVIAVAGNESLDLSAGNRTRLLFPADCTAPNLIVVGASDQQDELTKFSNYGVDKVHLVAPGVTIWGTGVDGEPFAYTGTSLSSAIAAGVLALVKSYHPDYSTAQLKRALIESGDQNPKLLGKVLGGRLNAYKALTIAIP